MLATLLAQWLTSRVGSNDPLKRNIIEHRATLQGIRHLSMRHLLLPINSLAYMQYVIVNIVSEMSNRDGDG